MSVVSMAGEENKLKPNVIGEKGKAKGRDHDAIVAGLQKLREQQRSIVLELTRVEDDKREHERVLEVLREIEGNRKCFRMIGTTLVEYQISTVIPILESTLSNLKSLAFSLKENLIEKGKELQEYAEKNNIHFVTDKQTGKQSGVTR